LLIAFARLKKDKNFDCSLVIVGKQGWRTKEIFHTYRSLRLSDTEVRFTGYVSEGDLAVLYRTAAAFVFVSLYEGFGLTALEAMSTGVPVVASDIPVFREVLADAALFVDPHDPDDIAAGIRRLLSDRAMADRLRRRGLQRVDAFSWEKSSRKTLALFEAARGPS
jgi:glycosyltransferase involved in cell wall biosynthesis